MSSPTNQGRHLFYRKCRISIGEKKRTRKHRRFVPDEIENQLLSFDEIVQAETVRVAG